MKIAIDGTAGSGKGTLSKRLSKKLKIPYLDTGILYRKVAFEYLMKFGNEKIEEDTILTSNIIGLVQFINFDDLNQTDLKKDKIGFFASKIAKISKLRKKLDVLQLNYINNMTNIHGGCILDGRDIGTTIMPDAEIKFFITATVESRTKRRFKELKFFKLPVKEQVLKYDELFAKIQLRDESDYKRDISPLKKAIDSFEIDTTKLTPKEVEVEAMGYIRKKSN